MPVTIDGTTGITTPAENTAALTVGSITGILKATSGVVSQAVAGTDYLVGGGSAITSTNTAKAWVNFNGTTSPGTIRSSFNVSSVTKNGTGDYTVNFATPMADTNYSVLVSSNNNGASLTASRGEPMADCIINLSTTSFGYNHREGAGGALTDIGRAMIAIFGN